MARSQNPTDAIRETAISMPSVEEGISCNQSSFKVGKGAFLFLGPGPKGSGYKAMFKLDRSMDQARKLAAKEPERFEVGKTGWVTARFTDERPLVKSIWGKWVKESYALTTAGAAQKPAAKKTAKKAARKKPTRPS